jgi:hypothetical protein
MNKEFLIKMPGYREVEYLIILNPHEGLREKITNIKRSIHQEHQTSIPFSGKPAIRLAKFSSLEMMEEKLVNHLKLVAMAMPRFKVSLKDYGTFPTHTLLINVTSKIPLQMLVKELRTAKRLIKSPENEPQFINEFYVPVAIKLTPVQYEKIWLEYQHRQFTGSFIADHMLLLKKRPGEINYQVAQRFEFLNLPVSIKQGELFA